MMMTVMMTMMVVMMVVVVVPGHWAHDLQWDQSVTS